MASIKKNQLAPLWLAKVPLAVIAESFGISESWVSQLAKGYGLPSRARGAVKEVIEERPAVMREQIPDRPGWNYEMDVLLLQTGGAYGPIADLAARWGKTTKQVIARYHLVAK